MIMIIINLSKSTLHFTASISRPPRYLHVINFLPRALRSAIRQYNFLLLKYLNTGYTVHPDFGFFIENHQKFFAVCER